LFNQVFKKKKKRKAKNTTGTQKELTIVLQPW